jgi:mono/diheme cytochrome c family protein
MYEEDTFEDDEDVAVANEFDFENLTYSRDQELGFITNCSSCHGARVSSTGRFRKTDDQATVLVSPDAEEEEEEEEEEEPKVERRNGSVAEEELIELRNVSFPVRRAGSCNIPGPGADPCPTSTGLMHRGGAAFVKLVTHMRSGPAVRKQLVSQSINRAGVVEADIAIAANMALGRSGCHGCHVSGKLAESAGGERSSCQKLENPVHVIGKSLHHCGIDVEELDAHHADFGSSSRSDNSSSQSRLIKRLEQELEIQPSLRPLNTRIMSRTNPARRRSVVLPRTDVMICPRGAAAAVSLGSSIKRESWNASIRTAQDFEAQLRDKERALMKRERALNYGHSIRRTSYRHIIYSSQLHDVGKLCSSNCPGSSDEARRTPDRLGWVWNWLERLEPEPLEEEIRNQFLAAAAATNAHDHHHRSTRNCSWDDSFT